jgi:hypothetical protein
MGTGGLCMYGRESRTFEKKYRSRNNRIRNNTIEPYTHVFQQASLLKCDIAVLASNVILLCLVPITTF